MLHISIIRSGNWRVISFHCFVYGKIYTLIYQCLTRFSLQNISFTVFNSLFAVSNNGIFLCEQNKLVSSAYIIGLGNLIAFSKSLTKMRKSKGPNIESVKSHILLFNLIFSWWLTKSTKSEKGVSLLVDHLLLNSLETVPDIYTQHHFLGLYFLWKGTNKIYGI